MESYTPGRTAARILCCECGTPIEANAANTCLECIRARVDITAGIPKQIVVNWCRGCERYLQPPAHWLHAALESKELLALLLRKMRGMAGARLIDASFVWTEPHSRRLKMRLTIQKDASGSGSGGGTNAILQQSFVVEAVVANQQCPDCARREAKNTWNTVVQVRQKAAHRRTFLFLEQQILRHSAHRDTVNIRPVRDGVDFFFAARTHAQRFADFLGAVVPLRSKASEQLLTSDVHSGQSTYKFTISVEIVPVCRDDAVYLPPKTARALGGGFGPLVLVSRVGTTLHFVCPRTAAAADLPCAAYWRDAFPAVASSPDLVEYIVLDTEPADVPGAPPGVLVDATVARASDFGRSSTTHCVRSHLGRLLRPGDVALGYDLAGANLAHEAFAAAQAADELPDVLLVRKSYAHLRREGRRARAWTLRQLPMEVEPGVTVDTDTGLAPAADVERFMQELEEDAEMRRDVNMYRVPRPRASAMTDGETTDGERAPSVPLEELLDDLVLEDA